MGSSETERIAARRGRLIARGELLRVMREFFWARSFVEIEAPVVVPSPGLELHLDAFELKEPCLFSDRPAYLITSPEYQMKRLLAGGFERIYSLGKVFRRGEAGHHHNPEFTMLEWYRSDAPDNGWQAVAADVEALTVALWRHLQTTQSPLLPSSLDLTPPWDRLSVRDAFSRYAAIELDGNEPALELRDKARAAGHRVPDRGDYSDVFFQLFLDCIEPQLTKNARPVIVCDWPAPLCALARHRPDDPRVVERFEAYVGPLELCNGFGELIDADEQRARLVQDRDERRKRRLPEYPIDERFLNALSQMKPAGGVALGVDRLMMLLLGADDIRQVLPFSADEL